MADLAVTVTASRPKVQSINTGEDVILAIATENLATRILQKIR